MPSPKVTAEQGLESMPSTLPTHDDLKKAGSLGVQVLSTQLIHTVIHESGGSRGVAQLRRGKGTRKACTPSPQPCVLSQVDFRTAIMDTYYLFF